MNGFQSNYLLEVLEPLDSHLESAETMGPSMISYRSTYGPERNAGIAGCVQTCKLWYAQDVEIDTRKLPRSCACVCPGFPILEEFGPRGLKSAAFTKVRATEVSAIKLNRYPTSEG